ncbi:MAG: prepilin-type N-terminal cleavage/methylation domain-containing protein [Candidatus Liptonbacteria bacterium]|nr:prepilin-type N-terminal cleavage/methylation domain-containing protein [Candidatus Liptonbacteria bacterium]
MRMKKLFAFRFSLFASAAGFTLIELIVTVAITTLLVSMPILYGSRSRGQVTLFVNTSRVAQEILRAKSLTLAAYATTTASGVPCAYGVQVTRGSNTFNLFQYPRSGCAPTFTSMNPGLELPVENFVLDSAVRFRSAGTTARDVMFIPPDPTTVIYDGSAILPNGGQIILETTDGADSAVITINSFGQVTF